MRTMMMCQMDTEKTNEAINGDRLDAILRSLMDRVRPEAAYFGAMDGMRTAFVVFDMEDPAQVPVICEPLFMELNARITLIPVMNGDDVRTGVGRFLSS
ncbi:hypothetical protein E2C00_10170 [Streptomyces sp. WAC05374]|uniref:hypothetical protein n=1 Tax=Streptomyces sp. WAC05374 TaxID=2487420 RepID=UPI000F86F1AB|nr:hypothetical protein [Streptomyces sp. WAC05374]RST16611.1 hypothetical protein EF905_11845 [Streptomyces sp. WAC05374]TDF47147.1 hypothetical protein E2B92_08995 [Streptomyces sp. WAC05374]TDF57405.1 hypothetical protein E2C00_10170 [Streptomyces sp. WAC05374]TDF61510.1 hypothetical protein E2C02_01370 [Streptomyces sp. WAC05374]